MIAKTSRLSIRFRKAFKQKQIRGEYNPERRGRNGRKLSAYKQRRYDRKIRSIADEKQVVEEYPASFGHFTIEQLKTILNEIELFPTKDEWVFKFTKNGVYIVTIAEEDDEDEED